MDLASRRLAAFLAIIDPEQGNRITLPALRLSDLPILECRGGRQQATPAMDCIGIHHCDARHWVRNAVLSRPELAGCRLCAASILAIGTPDDRMQDLVVLRLTDPAPSLRIVWILSRRH